MQVNRWERTAETGAWPGLLGLVWLALLLLSVQAHAADATAAVGEVTFVQGIATAQRGGEAPRFLAKGEPVYEGDTLSTGAKGFALVQLKDGTKLTLRPNTAFTVDRFRDQEGSEAAIFKLLKGGVRTLTGLISKRNPKAVEFQTTTATIGIRGTSFDARICEADCAEEQRAAKKPGAAAPDPIVARVAVLSGSASAVNAAGQTRPLTEGAALFNGDAVRTSKASYAVLGFRDQSKVTVTADSEFKLENVRFNDPKGESGNFVVRIVRGGVRALTGVLAKKNPKAVSFGATTAVIGLRGTGHDTYVTSFCFSPQECSESAIVSVWESDVDLIAAGRTLGVDNGRVGVYVPARDLLTLLDAIPPVVLQEPAPRPDTVNVDFDQLFSELQLDTPGAGVIVAVRDGAVILTGPGGSIVLGMNETGWLALGQTVPVRVTLPLFMSTDPVPTPESFDERSFRLLELLNPGEVICEIR